MFDVRTAKELLYGSRKEKAVNELKPRITFATARTRLQEGKIGYILLWALGVPIPVLIVIYLLRGCS